MATYYTRSEAAEYLRVSPDIIQRAQKSGDLAPVAGLVINGRRVAKEIYEGTELDRWATDSTSLVQTVP